MPKISVAHFTAIILTGLLSALPLCAQDPQTDYQQKVASIRAKFNELEMQPTDYRNAKRALDFQKEAER